jgi:WD40 repeat protein
LWVLVRGLPRVLDADTGKLVRQFETISGWRGPIVFSPDGKRIATPDGVRDVNSGELLWRAPGFDDF